MKDVQSAEFNEKSIFRFLFFELWLIIFTIYQKFIDQKKVVQKRSNLQETCAHCSENDFLVLEFFWCDF